jgi:hypothetical protein
VRQYQVNARGATHPIDIVDENGKTVKISVLQFKTKRIAEAVAEELNRAFASGQAEAVDGAAEMLFSRFNQDGYGEWQDGWRAAAKEVRGWRPGGIDSQANGMVP